MDWLRGCLQGIVWFGLGCGAWVAVRQGSKQSSLVAAVFEVLFGWDGVHAAVDGSALSFRGRRKAGSVSRP